jgi:transcriptional regulator with XRE-family HTH domain
METRIRELCKRRGMTAEELAAAARIPAATIAALEAGGEDLSVEAVERIADVLDCSTDYTLFGRYTARDFRGVDLVAAFKEFIAERAGAVHAAA